MQHNYRDIDRGHGCLYPAATTRVSIAGDLHGFLRLGDSDLVPRVSDGAVDVEVVDDVLGLEPPAYLGGQAKHRVLIITAEPFKEASRSQRFRG
jgi:hypothetical protein